MDWKNEDLGEIYAGLSAPSLPLKSVWVSECLCWLKMCVSIKQTVWKGADTELSFWSGLALFGV